MAIDLNYGIGVEGKNLVLKTLGRVYVKVKDRKYELKFKPEDYQELFSEMDSTNNNKSSIKSSVMLLNSISEFSSIEYPGDNILIITKDGGFYFTGNNSYTQIQPQFSVDNLSVDTIRVGNQIIFTGTQTPFVINSTNLINNLNADLLDGLQGSQYAVKDKNEYISGNWTFANQITANSSIIQNSLSDPLNQKIKIDFTTGTISCKRLIVPEDETIDMFDYVSGVGKEVWLNYQISGQEIIKVDTYDNVKLEIIANAYQTEELANWDKDEAQIDIDFWYDLFFSSYNLNDLTYTLRDFEDEVVIEEANTKLNRLNQTIDAYTDLINGFKSPDLSEYQGSVYQITVSSAVPILVTVPNLLFKSNSGNVGVILNRKSDNIIVKFKESNISFFDKLVLIGSVYDTSAVLMQAKTNSISILENALDTSNPTVHIGKLENITSDIFPKVTGIGLYLNGSTSTEPIEELTVDNLTKYEGQSGIYLKNANLRWTNSSIFNDDGSGMIGNGLIQWLPNKLNINNPNITCKQFVLKEDGSGNIGSNFKWDQNGNVTYLGDVSNTLPRIIQSTFTGGQINNAGPTNYCDITVDTTSSPGLVMYPGTFIKIQSTDNVTQTVQFQIHPATDIVDPSVSKVLSIDVLPKTVHFYYYAYGPYNEFNPDELKVIEIWRTNRE